MTEDKQYIYSRSRKTAFTLAETLITLLVIGVVAVLTIPALTQQITNYTLNKQKKVFSSKWAEGLRRMRADGKLESSYTTKDFINEMGKHFAIATVCDSDNLSNCFTEKITSYESDTNGEVFEVKDLKSAKNFNKSEEDSPVYGIKFTDGTSMLLAYKKDCTGIPEGDTNGNHTQCLLYVYDVNGDKAPNSYGGNTGVGVQKNGKELSDSDRDNINKGRDLVGNASITKGNAYGLDFEIINNTSYAPGSCVGNICYSAVNGDYWQGARDFCTALGGSLPDTEKITQMVEKIYIDSGICTCTVSAGRYECHDSNWNSTCDVSALTSIPLWQLIAAVDINRGGQVWGLAGNTGNFWTTRGLPNVTYAHTAPGISPLCVK